MEYNYQTCIQKMKDFEPFAHYHHTMQGAIYNHGVPLKLIYEYEFHYCIYSYNQRICIINFEHKTYCINPTRYSTTTSKQVSYIRQAAESWERKGYRRILWL